MYAATIIITLKKMKNLLRIFLNFATFHTSWQEWMRRREGTGGKSQQPSTVSLTPVVTLVTLDATKLLPFISVFYLLLI